MSSRAYSFTEQISKLALSSPTRWQDLSAKGMSSSSLSTGPNAVAEQSAEERVVAEPTNPDRSRWRDPELAADRVVDRTLELRVPAALAGPSNTSSVDLRRRRIDAEEIDDFSLRVNPHVAYRNQARLPSRVASRATIGRHATRVAAIRQTRYRRAARASIATTARAARGRSRDLVSNS